MYSKMKFVQPSLFFIGFCAWSTVFLMQPACLQAQDKPAQKAASGKKAASDKVAAVETSVKVKTEELLIILDVEGIYEATDYDEIVLDPKQWKTLKVKKALAHGSLVTEGDPVLWIETKELDKELAKQKRSLESTEVSLKLASDDLRFTKESTAMDLESSDRKAQIAKEELDYFLKIREPQSIKSADMNLKFSKYSLEYAREELNQLQQMYEADDLTEQTEEIILKRAQRSVEASEYSLKRAEISHKRTIATSLPREKQSLVDSQSKTALGRAKSVATLPLLLRKKELELAALQRDVEELNKKITELERDRESMTIYANRSGLLFYGRCVNGKWSEVSAREKQLKPSGTVTARQVLMTIVAPASLRVRMSLTEQQLAQATLGQAAIVKSNSVMNHSSIAEISQINRIVQGDGKYLAIASTKNNPELLITPGMTCQVKIRVHQNQKAILIPTNMVHQEDFAEDSRPFVWVKVAGDEKSKKQFLETGYTKNGKIEIVTGLKAGDVVLAKKP